MPAVSEKQKKAMYAAAEGKSNLGIPTSVGKEFVGKDGQLNRKAILKAAMDCVSQLMDKRKK